MFGTPGRMSSSQQKTPKGKGNTLLNYFSKTQGSSQRTGNAQGSQLNSPRASSSTVFSPKPTATVTPTRKHSSGHRDSVGENTAYVAGDLVMAQVEGHQFWPGVVICEDGKPSQRKFKVLFLGEYSHAWVALR